MAVFEVLSQAFISRNVIVFFFSLFCGVFEFPAKDSVIMALILLPRRAYVGVEFGYAFRKALLPKTTAKGLLFCNR